jgi:hypothetical protein
MLSGPGFGARLLARFTVRKVTKSWMVWDTATQSIAVIDDRPAIGLSERGALRVADMLNSQAQARG